MLFLHPTRGRVRLFVSRIKQKLLSFPESRMADGFWPGINTIRWESGLKDASTIFFSLYLTS